MEQLRRDIAEAEARMRVTFGTRSAIRNLVESLDDGEQVVAMVACFYSGSDGLLVLTDRRVIAVRDDYSKFRLQAVPLRDITALDYAPSVHDGLAVLTDAGRVAVRKMDRTDSDALAAALVERVPHIVIGASRPGADPHRVGPTTGGQPAVSAESTAGGPGQPTSAPSATGSALGSASGSASAASAPASSGSVAAGAGQQAVAASAAEGAVRDRADAGTAGGSTGPASGSAGAGQDGADKDVLLGVLADLHAKGLLSAEELAAKIAQVTSS